MAVAVSNSLSELDAMLHDLRAHKYSVQGPRTPNPMDDYSSDYGGTAASMLSDAPLRPPPPASYAPASTASAAGEGGRSRDMLKSGDSGTLKLPPRLKPPKLQHHLQRRPQRLHHKLDHQLIKSGPRLEGVMGAPDYDSEYETDYDESDYAQAAQSIIPSDDELLDSKKLDTGETPRGDESMFIKTDHGKLKSKYRYLGFGMWENTDPDPPPVFKKPSPPPPPPKAEPIWYNCSVVVESHCSSKELDDLEHGLGGFDRMAKQDVEVGNAGAGLPGCLGDIYEEFEKEDMSEMFRRAFLEKMGADEPDNRAKHKCQVCGDRIGGRIITALSGRKFHPKCFVCTYCRKGFKDRKYKSDDEFKPYCYQCFEKLLGHFGSAHFQLSELP